MHETDSTKHKRDVVLSNFNRQHSFRTAVALNTGGHLRRFITGTAVVPDSRLERITARRIAGRSLSWQRKLAQRSIDLASPVELVTYPWLEATEYVLLRVLPKRARDRTRLTITRAAAFDWFASRHVADGDIVHAFEQCCARTLAVAKSKGARTILDQSILAWPEFEKRMRLSHEHFGVPLPRVGSVYRGHVTRKARERELADYALAGLAEVRDSMVDAGFPRDRIFVVPYGADVNRLSPKPRRPMESFRIIFVGHRSWQKGLPNLLAALSEIAEPRLELRVFGASDTSWERLLEGMRRRLVDSGARVTFHDTIAQSELYEQYFAADCLVFPSLIGGVGLATLEALATGLPVIVSSADVLLSDRVDCLVADPGDPNALVEAIGELRDTPTLRRSLSEAGAVTAKRFSWDAYGEGILAAHEAVRGGEPGRVILPA
jgi:glycosyltransferase involved in cell wall biosynthesis